MKVFVLNICYDYEGETTIGVFCSHQAALSRANDEAKGRSFDGSLVQVEKYPHLWAEHQECSTQYAIREFSVRDAFGNEV